MRAWARTWHRSGRTIGLVPTMGALHAGHVSLIERANELSDTTVVSIFVNPLQFGEATDFDTYPRTLDDDVAVCTAAGVSAVYAPTIDAMYPSGFDTRVVPGRLAATMEGTSRPGHFDGVATVVTKLFGAVRPDVACFGEKDFQQLAIVRRVAADLDLGVQVVACPTLREDDGLALSSRNRRLRPAERLAARCIPDAIVAARASARRGGDADAVLRAARTAIDAERLAALEYATLFDPDTLETIEQLPGPAEHGCRLALAVRIGEVRLIDNIDLWSD